MKVSERGDVSFGLVVVVIAHEILDGVFGEEPLELAVELGGERLVGREDDRRALGGLDHLGGGEGLARAGGAEQHLVLLARGDALDELGDGGRLVSGGLEMRMQHEASAAFELGAAARIRHRVVQDGHVIGVDCCACGQGLRSGPLTLSGRAPGSRPEAAGRGQMIRESSARSRSSRIPESRKRRRCRVRGAESGHVVLKARLALRKRECLALRGGRPARLTGRNAAWIRQWSP